MGNSYIRFKVKSTPSASDGLDDHGSEGVGFTGWAARMGLTHHTSQPGLWGKGASDPAAFSP